MKKETVAFSGMACAVLALVFGGGLSMRPASAENVCPAGTVQKGMETFDVSKPHCIRDGATPDRLPLDKVAHQEAARPRQPGYDYCVLLHPGGEDC